MKRVLCLRFPNWPIQQLRISSTTESHQPIALISTPDDVSDDLSTTSRADGRFLRRLFPSVRTGPAVVAVNELAWRCGVRPGMPLAEARSMGESPAASMKFQSWSAATDRQTLVELAEEARPFAPIIGLDELPLPDCLLLDITGCAPLFGGETVLVEQLTGRLRALGFQPRVAISETVATAWAFAHADQRTGVVRKRGRLRTSVPARSAEWQLPVVIIPPGQAREYLDELPVSSGRLHPDDIDILEQLGICTLKRVLQLPLDDLPTRLSREAVTRIRQLLGDQAEQIVPLPESCPIQAHWTAEFPARNRNAVRQVLEHLCERISEQLLRRLMGATRLECELQLDDRSVVLLMTEFVRPVQASDVMREMLMLRMESVTVPGPVTSALMRAVVSPLPTPRQRDLFSRTEHLRPQEDLAVLLNRVSNRLGHQAALQAELTQDARPEFAVRLFPVTAENSGRSDDRLSRLVTPETSAEQDVPRFQRPVRLFAEPRRLDGLPSHPAGASFCFEGHTESIVHVTGPERLQTAWWEECPAHRDYFRVRTIRGSEYWLFRQLQTGQWYLHGLFD